MAGERYFMASVDLLSAKARIERILEDLERHNLVPSLDMISGCVSDLTAAMCKVSRDRLSDRPGCQGGCGREAHFCGYEGCS